MSVRTVERKISTLVPVPVPGDSTLIRAVFECDSLYNVLLKEYAEVKGKKIESDFSLNNGALDYRARFKPDTIYLTSDTIYIEKDVPVVVETQKTVYRQTLLQKILTWTGVIALSIIALWGVFTVIKRKF